MDFLLGHSFLLNLTLVNEMDQPAAPKGSNLVPEYMGAEFVRGRDVPEYCRVGSCVKL